MVNKPKPAKKPETVKDREVKTGKPNTIKNPNGKDSRSDQQVVNLKKRFAKLVTDFDAPKKMPTEFLVRYGTETKTVAAAKVKQLAAFAKLIGAIQ